MNPRDALDYKLLLMVARVILLVMLFITSGLYIAGKAEEVAAAYFNGPPLEFRDQPWPTQNAAAEKTMVFRPGESVWAAADFRVAFPGEFVSQQQIVGADDGQARRIPDVATSISPGVYRTNARAGVVPADLPAGRYRIVGRSTLKSWLRTYTADWQTAVFSVEP